jgi:alanine racemase
MYFMSRPLIAAIDYHALRHNLECARRAAPQARLMAVVKADAYGHGLIECARAVAGADALAVACIEEALSLRAAGIQQPIVLLEGFFDATELPLLVHHQLHTVIHCFEQVTQLRASGLHIPIWLKITTGMHRLGFRPEELPQVWAMLGAYPQVRVMSHLACADERTHPATLAQWQCFDHATAALGCERSLANSAAILAWPHTHVDWVRPGLMLYGASPFPEHIGTEFGLRPVMHLRSQLIRINHCCAGEKIGYGGTWECPQDMNIGIIAAGYGDGYPRHAPSGTPVLLNNAIVPLIGRVSMDMISVDLRTQPQARIGDPVTLWGHGLAVETVAASAGTIAYDLLTAVTPRVKRCRYVSQEETIQSERLLVK